MRRSNCLSRLESVHRISYINFNWMVDNFFFCHLLVSTHCMILSKFPSLFINLTNLLPEIICNEVSKLGLGEALVIVNLKSCL